MSRRFYLVEGPEGVPAPLFERIDSVDSAEKAAAFALKVLSLRWPDLRSEDLRVHELTLYERDDP